jgi:hypothetical protein
MGGRLLDKGLSPGLAKTTGVQTDGPEAVKQDCAFDSNDVRQNRDRVKIIFFML